MLQKTKPNCVLAVVLSWVAYTSKYKCFSKDKTKFQRKSFSKQKQNASCWHRFKFSCYNIHEILSSVILRKIESAHQRSSVDFPFSCFGLFFVVRRCIMHWNKILNIKICFLWNSIFYGTFDTMYGNGWSTETKRIQIILFDTLFLCA